MPSLPTPLPQAREGSYHGTAAKIEFFRAEEPLVEPTVIIILVIAAVIVLAVLAQQQAKKRRMALAAWAASRGLTFDPSHDGGMDDRYPGFTCLRQGDDRYAYNVMAGQVARGGGASTAGVTAFDYHYETSSTDSEGKRTTHDHHFSAVIVAAGLPLKPLLIRKEGFFDKVGAFLGFEDIDFESTEFSKEFFVKSPDRRWAFDVLQQSTMEFLLAAPRFSLEFQGSDVIAYRDRTFKPEDFDAALTVIAGVLDRLPDYLLKEMKGTNGSTG